MLTPDTGPGAKRNGTFMQLIKVAGRPGPARDVNSGWRQDVIVGHRLTGGPLMVHSPDQACSWCAPVPNATGPMAEAINGDRTILMDDRQPG